MHDLGSPTPAIDGVEESDLRVQLLNAQFDLGEGNHGVLVLVAGDDRPGSEEVVDRIHEWMDPRLIDTHVFGAPSPEEQDRPRFWRYWRALPRAGRMSLVYGGWPQLAVAERVRQEIDPAAFRRRIEQSRCFEQNQTDAGLVVVKIWIHLREEDHQLRLQRAITHPQTAWELDSVDWAVCERWKEMLPVAREFLESTHHPDRPWVVLDGSDREARDLQVGVAILEALRRKPARPPKLQLPAPVEVPRLASVVQQEPLDRDDYRARLKSLQGRLNHRMRRVRTEHPGVVLVFEGWDAAGKGGAIRRVMRALPARDYRVVQVSAPDAIEREHHYLWRFWRQLARKGRMLIFDRSWYGRVLVERVEGLARKRDWRRAYGEIRDFERQLREHGLLVLKFWMQIDREEQRRRFELRERTPYKKHKITAEDYRNRDRWEDYVPAIEEMLSRTDRDEAPWLVVPANDKRRARLMVLEEVVTRLEADLNGTSPPDRGD